MAIVYEKSFSASLDDNLAQKAMPLPALTKGTGYTFTVGFSSWQSYWNNLSSLQNDDYKWSVNGAFDADSNQNPSITFTPDVNVALSESFLRVVGEYDFKITVSD